MAKLYFYFGSMNSGKTTSLLQSAYNYNERGMRTLLLKPRIDTREGNAPVIKARIDIESKATIIGHYDEDIVRIVKHDIETNGKLWCVMVDESQFLTAEQVKSLAEVVDDLDIPVLCYGLRTDFRGDLFPGSLALMATADKFVELKGICSCSKKATHVLRMDSKGNVVVDGQQIEVGGNDKYVSVCRKCHRREMTNASGHREFTAQGHRIRVISVRDDITGAHTALKSPLDVTHLFKIDDRTKTVWPRKLVLSNLAAELRDTGESLGAVDWDRVTFEVAMYASKLESNGVTYRPASAMPQEFEFDNSTELEVHEFYTWAEGKVND